MDAPSLLMVVVDEQSVPVKARDRPACADLALELAPVRAGRCCTSFVKPVELRLLASAVKAALY